jgi:hypothetical protein
MPGVLDEGILTFHVLPNDLDLNSQRRRFSIRHPREPDAGDRRCLGR